MKKIIITCLVLVIIACGCGKQFSDPTGSRSVPPVDTTTKSAVFSINPLSGIGGTQVTLTGIHMGALASTTVSFGGIAAKIIYTDSLRIIVAAPDSVKTGPMTLTTGGKSYSGPVFTIISVQSITPAAAGVGGAITITGTGFNSIPAQNIVVFNGKDPQGNPANLVGVVIKASPDTLQVQVPRGVIAGTVTVNPNQQNVITGPFFNPFIINSVAPLGFPYVSSSGFPQLITGYGFSPILSQNQVTINGLKCQVSYVSPTGDTLVFYPADLVNPSQGGLANGPLIVRSGDQSATYTVNGTTQNFFYQEVFTLAGGNYGMANGVGRQAQFETLSGITVDGAGNVYVTDKEANNIRKITPNGVVSLLAGSAAGLAGYQDGFGANALFNGPSGIAVDNTGTLLLVADSGNFRIRKIILATDSVSTLIGTGVAGLADGAGGVAQFIGPNSLVYDGSSSSFFLTDAANGQGSVRQLFLTYDGRGSISTVVTGLALPDAAANVSSYYFNDLLYVDQANQVIGGKSGGLYAGMPGVKGYQDGNGGTALFNTPVAVVPYLTAATNSPSPPYATQTSLVSDRDNNVIRNVNFASPVMVFTQVGGMGTGKPGFTDGGYRTALFNKPGPMYALSTNGGYTIYLCDIGNHAIRMFY